jgi:DNA-directed RNA polymerase subunit M/transcription elongation factor TFIIS
VTTEKACARCGELFQPRTNGGKSQRYCSERCGWRASNAAKYERHRDPVLIRQRELIYGLSMGEYAAMREAQNGLCAICGGAETSYRGSRLRSLSVDHDHETGALRGLLCNRCNRALGGFEDSSDLLRAAAAYLDSHKREAVA